MFGDHRTRVRGNQLGEPWCGTFGSGAYSSARSPTSQRCALSCESHGGQCLSDAIEHFEEQALSGNFSPTKSGFTQCVRQHGTRCPHEQRSIEIENRCTGHAATLRTWWKSRSARERERPRLGEAGPLNLGFRRRGVPLSGTTSRAFGGNTQRSTCESMHVNAGTFKSISVIPPIICSDRPTRVMAWTFARSRP